MLLSQTTEAEKLFVVAGLIVKFTSLPFSKFTTTGTSVKVGLLFRLILALPLNDVLLPINTILAVGEAVIAPVEFVNELIESVPFSLPFNLNAVACHLKFCTSPLLPVKLQFPPIIRSCGRTVCFWKLRYTSWQNNYLSRVSFCIEIASR